MLHMFLLDAPVSIMDIAAQLLSVSVLELAIFHILTIPSSFSAFLFYLSAH